jgi:hypothetical protein
VVAGLADSLGPPVDFAAPRRRAGVAAGAVSTPAFSALIEVLEGAIARVTNLGDMGLMGAGMSLPGRAEEITTADLVNDPTVSGGKGADSIESCGEIVPADETVGAGSIESFGEIVPSEETVDWENLLKPSGANSKYSERAGEGELVEFGE